MSNAFQVEALAPPHAAATGDMLGRAFAENPVARAALAHCTKEARRSRVMRLNRALVRQAQGFGVAEIVRAEGRVLGASLHFAPGTYPVGPRGLAWTVLGGLSVGVRGALRYLTFENHVAPHHPREPYWYLFVLGVEPEWQGRGVGSALLGRFCEKASASGHPAYLETDLPSSVRLYERHGFVVVQEFDIAPLGGLHMWTMRRP